MVSMGERGRVEEFSGLVERNEDGISGWRRIAYGGLWMAGAGLDVKFAHMSEMRTIFFCVSSLSHARMR